MPTIKEMLQSIISDCDGNQAKAARRIGISKAYVTNILKGDRGTSAGSEELISKSYSERGNARPASHDSGLRRVPIVSLAQAGTVARDYQDLCAQIDETVETGSRDPNAFAIIIVGDSMEPYASAGDVAVFNPNTEAQSGRPALVRMKQTGETLFKWFFTSGEKAEKIWLASENPDYEPKAYHRDQIEWIYPIERLVRQNQTRRFQDFMKEK